MQSEEHVPRDRRGEEYLFEPGAFLRDEHASLCVGYASDDSGEWATVEAEPFSMRALGYYERRLKRIGEPVDTRPRHEPL